MARLLLRPLPVAALVWFVLSLTAARGDANDAFPDSQSIIVPAERPNDITLATNFGLVSTTDGGATWTWACEVPASNNAHLYQVGAAPGRRLFALSTAQGTNDRRLVFTDDRACGWQVSGGLLASALVLDAFPDPSDPRRVLAIAATTAGAAPAAHGLFESGDGGATFTQMRYMAPAGDQLTGAEIARSDPKFIYVTVSSGAMLLPRLLQSTDGGAHWTSFDLQASLGGTSIRLIAVDPERPERVFLRASGAQDDKLAIAVVDASGGISVKVVLTVSGGRLAAFVRLPSKTILTAGAVGANLAPALFRSTDGGDTFAPVPNPPHLRALAARASRVFAAADLQQDGFALGASADEGMTWQPLMRLDQVGTIQGCLKDACQTSCHLQVDNHLWSLSTCEANDGPAATPDAGTSDAGTSDGGTSLPPPSSGGGCQVGRGGGGGRGVALGALFVLAAALVFRRTLSHKRLRDVAAREQAARHDRKARMESE